MINAWSLAYDVLNGTLDENFPIKKDKMTDDIKIETSKDEGVVNVPSDVNLDATSDDINIETTSDKKVFNVSYDGLKHEHSDAWYDYTRNDPDRENPFTDPKDRARAERVVSGGNTAANSAEELTISIPPEFNLDTSVGRYATSVNYSEAVDHLVDEMPPAFTALSDNDDAIAHLIDTPVSSGIEDNSTRKYKEDESIEALKNYISTTYGGHYTSDNNNVQTLDLIESVGDAEAFCRSNAIKYLTRYDKKGQAKRDILKALHYSLLLYHFSGQLNETPTRGYETF